MRPHPLSDVLFDSTFRCASRRPNVVRTSPLHAVVVPFVVLAGGDAPHPVDERGVLRWTPDEQVYVVGHDLGLGQFEVFVLTDFREDGFETFLRLPRQMRTPIFRHEHSVVGEFGFRVTGTL